MFVPPGVVRAVVSFPLLLMVLERRSWWSKGYATPMAGGIGLIDFGLRSPMRTAPQRQAVPGVSATVPPSRKVDPMVGGLLRPTEGSQEFHAQQEAKKDGAASAAEAKRGGRPQQS
jgi:hypothetical protein